jgi:rubredoxin
MLRYCAWCGAYQGATPAAGHQIRANVCEIDTATICPACLSRLLTAAQEKGRVLSSEPCRAIP